MSESSRPYRSHRYPACDICRRRKTRCIRNLDDQACHFCRQHDLSCQVSSSNNTSVPDSGDRRTPRSKRTPSSRQRFVTQGPVAQHHPDFVVDDSTDSSRNDGDGVGGDAHTHSGHIIGPVAAPDVQVLEQYMSPSAAMPISHARPNPYTVYSSDFRNPIVYLKVPRHRVPSSKGNGSAGFRQYESVEKILEPHGADVVDLFFQSFHPAFPVLDEKTVLDSYRKKGLPHVLVCEIYAAAMISWQTSSKLVDARPTRPDIKYVWNKTVEALNEEFLAPGFSTVLSCILDLTGRPTTSMTYNAINIGRAVALSQSLGLNRDPTSWSLDQRQKALRIRTWWGVLIHDWWASLAHGTPPHVHPRQFDVPIPDVAALIIGGRNVDRPSSVRRMGAQSFRALCQLTEILGDILPFIYDIKGRAQESQTRSLKRVEAALEDWEANLPDVLNARNPDFQREHPGALNLELSFLAVKMCISRVSLLESSKPDYERDPEIPQYLQLQCRRAARAIVTFTISLRGEDFSTFWLPYTAYHFTSATTLILRCGLEAANDDITKECISSARKLVAHLRAAKAEVNWDLGDICLSQCGRVVQMLKDKQYPRSKRDRDGASRTSRHTEPSQPIKEPCVIVPQGTDANQQASTYGMDMVVQPDPLDPISNNNTRAHMSGGINVQDDVTMLEPWDPFSLSTIPDLWDTTDLDEYTEFTM
ncbi:fungal-specific transcription factor domain-containing protein [Exophiala viscosa]|uniref:Fungal-specific transcription factor domain-containing protein n=1 Tax=Exophiala viscosa TaxID=2486360 RepID=A0AAN6DWM8_9EURO|nr:fungal-specific transcription factor domain-containing protein [Exophiala viscosa]